HQYSGVDQLPICLTLMIGACPKTNPNITNVKPLILQSETYYFSGVPPANGTDLLILTGDFVCLPLILFLVTDTGD
mgnify:CR=1